jgi:hypothetical protein
MFQAIKRSTSLVILVLLPTTIGCRTKQKPSAQGDEAGKFSSVMVNLTPYEENPVFQGTGTDTWDKHIRERGFILVEEGVYKMWYTGYTRDSEPKYLGYANSADGISWQDHGDLVIREPLKLPYITVS